MRRERERAKSRMTPEELRLMESVFDNLRSIKTEVKEGKAREEAPDTRKPLQIELGYNVSLLLALRRRAQVPFRVTVKQPRHEVIHRFSFTNIGIHLDTAVSSESFWTSPYYLSLAQGKSTNQLMRGLKPDKVYGELISDTVTRSREELRMVNAELNNRRGENNADPAEIEKLEEIKLLIASRLLSYKDAPGNPIPIRVRRKQGQNETVALLKVGETPSVPYVLTPRVEALFASYGGFDEDPTISEDEQASESPLQIVVYSSENALPLRDVE